LSKNRRPRKSRLHREAATLPASTYLVLDADGKRRPLSPTRWQQYVASHVIVPIALGAAIARVRAGYTVKLDRNQEAVIVEINPQTDVYFKFCSNYWTVFWRAFIFTGQIVSLEEIKRAIAEDHQEPRYEVVARYRGVLA